MIAETTALAVSKNPPRAAVSPPITANSIMYDGRYFYIYDNMMDNNYRVYVYDKNKKLVNTLNTSQDCKELLFGDKDYFFRLDSKTVEDEMAVNLYAIDKSDIEKSTQWQLVYKNEN